ncbi:helix-turn-helix transcriptional regulator [Ensifer sp. MJa1]|uniref:helix-turn-helix transcriptional regulator n=1 Tax=Ensifer sp. MJa1 TaxID=2919888 RepID=UPI003009CD2F
MSHDTIIKVSTDTQQASNMGDLALSLMGGVGRSDFQDRLALSLKRHVAIDAGLILLYRRNAAPKILFNDWRTDKGLSDIRAYLQGPYRMDPFYQLALDNGDDGLYRLKQIDPSYDRSQYYRDYYQHSGLHDEINVFVGLDADTKIAISLARRRCNAAFSAEDQDFLQTAAPLLSMAVLRHFRDLRPESLGDESPSLQNALAQAIKNFGRSVLTDRECQVAQMILRGYSVKGAAEKLGISPATVKLHRRNLYAKLDITSQTALFSLFIDAVSSANNAFEDPLTTYLSPGSSLTGWVRPH